jgi:NAD(P)-dependent dehydrogenase (short-subunit alcohol dehydrogenase family)
MDNYTNQRVAIVTGGGTWIGAAICAALASQGCNVIVVGRRQQPIQQVVMQYSSENAKLIALSADVRCKEDRKKIIDTCLNEFHKVDILVNNAAITYVDSLLDYSEKNWSDVMKTNLDAPFFLSQLAIENMRERKWGRIINIASIYGSLALNNEFYPQSLPYSSPGNRGPMRACAYHASKGALLNLTREMAVAAGEWGITVNAVSPGMLPPDSPNDSLAYDVDILKRMTPIKQVGRPENIAHAVCYFTSDLANFTTGAELVVDGGWSIW